MNVRPKRYSDGTPHERLVMLYGDFLAIECEVYSPPSAEGRTVYVFLDDDDVTMLLRECRDAARYHRTKEGRKPTRWRDLLPPKRSAFEDLAEFMRQHQDRA